jgi:hypothetical protein
MAGPGKLLSERTKGFSATMNRGQKPPQPESMNKNKNQLQLPPTYKVYLSPNKAGEEDEWGLSLKKQNVLTPQTKVNQSASDIFFFTLALHLIHLSRIFILTTLL